MKFGWINVFGSIIVIFMLIPNIVYALKNRGEKNLCKNRFVNAVEHIGRYFCIILMWMPLMVWKFGFGSVGEMIIYFIGNGVFLIAYWIVFSKYMKNKKRLYAFILAVIPVCIFFMSGILLRHWLLVGAAVIFGATHLYVVEKNHIY